MPPAPDAPPPARRSSPSTTSSARPPTPCARRDELGGGRPLGAEWAQVARAGDRATEAYLATTAQFPLDGTGPVAGAEQADERALREIEAARETIRRFRSTHARTLDEAAHLLRALPVAVQEARTRAGRRAHGRADGRRLRHPLAAGGRAARRGRAGRGRASKLRAGIRERRTAATPHPRARPAAATLAAEAPRAAAGVRSAFSSVATRRAAAATKADRIPPALSALRREFSEPCSTRPRRRREEGAGGARRPSTGRSRRAHERADAGEWDDAADAIAEARAQLGAAEQAHDSVAGRLADLREVRADPGKLAADTRFVLRDAQRLVVDRGLVKRFGPILDAQSVRLQNAQDRLTGVHPDYWLYLSELRGVRHGRRRSWPRPAPPP